MLVVAWIIREWPMFASDDEEDSKDKAGLAPPSQDVKQRKKSMAERWNPNSCVSAGNEACPAGVAHNLIGTSGVDGWFCLAQPEI